MKSTTSIGVYTMPSRSAIFGEGVLEELLVELGDDALAAVVGVDAAGALADAVVEPLERLGLLVERLAAERVEHALHGLGDRVVLGEGVALEQRVEDRPGDQVLGKHLDGVVAADPTGSGRGAARRGSPRRPWRPRMAWSSSTARMRAVWRSAICAMSAAQDSQ